MFGACCRVAGRSPLLSIIAIAFASLWIAWFASASEGSVLGPAPVLILMWSGYILSSLLFVSSGELLLMGLLWIWTSLLSVYGGSVLAGALLPSESTHAIAETQAPRPALWRLKWVAAVSLLVGVANIVLLFAVRGFSVGDLLSFVIISEVSAANRGDLYGGTLEQGTLQRFAFIIAFLGCIYGGLLFRLARSVGERMLGVGPLLSVSGLYALFGSRMGVLFGGAFWIAAYLSCHVAASRGSRVLPVGFIIRLGLAAVVILLGLSTLTQVVRYAATQELDWYKMLADPFAFVAAFGIWFDASALDQDMLLWGARTFRRLFAIAGVYYEPQPAIEVGFTSSNIYSVFRDLIEDFGLAGSLLATTFLGFGGRLAFSWTSRGSAKALPWLVLCYAFAITSFASGLLQYTTTTAAMVLFILVEHRATPFLRSGST